MQFSKAGSVPLTQMATVMLLAAVLADVGRAGPPTVCKAVNTALVSGVRSAQRRQHGAQGLPSEIPRLLLPPPPATGEGYHAHARCEDPQRAQGELVTAWLLSRSVGLVLRLSSAGLDPTKPYGGWEFECPG